jgi:high-affinity iron transporter
MLGWHNIWMSRHGRELAAESTRIGNAVRAGSRPLYALSVVCGIAVLREGSEIVLFLYGIAVAGGSTRVGMAIGGALGVAAGAAAGAGLYFGLLRIPLRYLFATTTGLILLLAAGLASQAASFLAAADVVPTLGNNRWDTSAILTENSIGGQLAHVLVGYTARPAGIQIVFYLATLLVIGSLMWVFRAEPATPRERRVTT